MYLCTTSKHVSLQLRIDIFGRFCCTCSRRLRVQGFRGLGQLGPGKWGWAQANRAYVILYDLEACGSKRGAMPASQQHAQPPFFFSPRCACVSVAPPQRQQQPPAQRHQGRPPLPRLSWHCMHARSCMRDALHARMHESTWFFCTRPAAEAPATVGGRACRWTSACPRSPAETRACSRNACRRK